VLRGHSPSSAPGPPSAPPLATIAGVGSFRQGLWSWEATRGARRDRRATHAGPSATIRHGHRYLHHNCVVALLNDLFGIQARGGCSCAGPYGHRLLAIGAARSHAYRAEIGHGCEGIKPGWTRINFNYFISDNAADYLINAVDLTAAYGHRLLPDYRFDPRTGLWRHHTGPPQPTLRLRDLRYAPHGTLSTPARRPAVGEDPCPATCARPETCSPPVPTTSTTAPPACPTTSKRCAGSPCRQSACRPSAARRPLSRAGQHDQRGQALPIDAKQVKARSGEGAARWSRRPASRPLAGSQRPAAGPRSPRPPCRSNLLSLAVRSIQD
jgi:hypothetical protein